jgi:hypothetical protein
MTTPPLSPQRLCRNEQETALATRRSRWSGNEALGRKPFIGQLLACKPLEGLHLQEAR